jgi:hypothetical protein
MTPGNPLETAKAPIDALAANDWLRAAALVHPESLESWRKVEIGVLADEAEDLAQGPRHRGGGTLRTVNEDSDVVTAKLRRHGATVFPDLGLELTLADLAALGAIEFFALYLELTTRCYAATGPEVPPHLIGELVENEDRAPMARV